MGGFINFTNHPSSLWYQEQRVAVEEYGEIEDYPFPRVPAQDDEDMVERLAEKCAREIIEKQPAAVLCQGEYTLAFAVAFLLRKKGIKVLAACSERCVAETQEEGAVKKESLFRFVRFREIGKAFGGEREKA